MELKTKRQCSLRRQLEIVPADITAWHSLSEYHYRSHRLGAVDKIFAIRFKSSEQPKRNIYLTQFGGASPVGVIVYSLPVKNIALRNQATNNRYVGLGDRKATLQLLNQEIRCVHRIVIQPQFRGIGLGTWLVRETLPRAGTVFVEALAVMGQINPFFTKAGMTRYDGPNRSGSERILEAFRYVEISQKQLVDTKQLLNAIATLNKDKQKFIKTEMQRFATPFSRRLRREKQTKHDPETTELTANIVVEHAMARPIYFLWQKPLKRLKENLYELSTPH